MEEKYYSPFTAVESLEQSTIIPTPGLSVNESLHHLIVLFIGINKNFHFSSPLMGLYDPSSVPGGASTWFLELASYDPGQGDNGHTQKPELALIATDLSSLLLHLKY